MAEKIEPWFWVIAWLITIFGVSGNAGVIYLIATKQHLQRKTNWFIISLATADLLLSLTYIRLFHTCWKMDSCTTMDWLVTRQAIQWLFLYSSVTNLFIMTVDRYISLTSPLKHKRAMTPTLIARWVFTAWVIPMITRVFIFTPIYLHNKETALKYLVPIFMFSFEVAPSVLLPFFAFHIVCIVRKNRCAKRRRIKDSTFELKSPSIRVHFRNDRRKNYNVSVVVSVVALFIICYSVDVYTSVCDIFEFSSISGVVWSVQHILMVTNSAFNPIAYALFKRDIKQAIFASWRTPFNNQVSPSTVN